MTTGVRTTPGLETAIGRLPLANPVLLASGTCGYGEELAPFLDLRRLGGIVVKGISRLPRLGNPPPRIMETPSGMLNAVGLQNVGLAAFVVEKMPFLRSLGIPVIVNIFGETVEDYVAVAEGLSDVSGVAGLEVNISCPNVQRGGLAFGASPAAAAAVTRAVKAATVLPVIVKLTPNVTDVSEIAAAVEDAGADALSLINTLTGMSVDVETRRPHLHQVTGGLSGPAIRPVAVRMVWQVARRVSVPVIGLGGIFTARDALEFFIVGARAVQVGTASLACPRAALDVLEGLESFLQERGIAHIRDVVGSLQVPGEQTRPRAGSPG